MRTAKRVRRVDEDDRPARIEEVPEGINAKHAWIVANRSALQATGKNSGQGYAYADSADILNAVMPFVKQMGLSLRLSEVDSKVEFISHWDEEEGKFVFLVSSYVVAEAILLDPETDQEIRSKASSHAVDRNGDKAQAKALTGAYKYCLRYLFLLATGEDSESDEHDVAGKGGKRSGSSRKAASDDLL